MRDEPADRTPAAAELPPHPGAPRWVKVMGILVVLLVAVLLMAKLTGGDGGGHGPGRHSLPAAVAVAVDEVWPARTA